MKPGRASKAYEHGSRDSEAHRMRRLLGLRPLERFDLVTDKAEHAPAKLCVAKSVDLPAYGDLVTARLFFFW